MPPSEDQIEALFCDALEHPVDEREAFVRSAAGDQHDLAEAVLNLLQHDADVPPGFLAGDRTVARPEPEPDLAATDLPSEIGGYRIVRQIGAGGMGVIYEAEQTSPRRRVALKVIRPGLAQAEILRRFRFEAEVLGHLQHPGIAQIHEARVGEVAGSELPFLVMELVDGQRIDDLVRTRRFGPSEVAELVARVCDAVHYAHQKGVLHRDLKPSNILVTEFGSSLVEAGRDSSIGATRGTDSLGQPKVLDFGVARVTNAELKQETMLTSEGQIIGTLAYMSPEQVRGATNEIGTRSDVYSLGVILFELLTGRLPHDVSGLSIPEAARRICDEEPARAVTLQPTLRGDLDTILGKALERQPERRYDSALELAADLRRFANHEPILARPITTWYQISKFARRNKALVAVAMLATVAVVVALIGLSVQTVEANRQRDEAVRTAERLERVLDFQNAMVRDVELEPLGLEVMANLRRAVLSQVSEEERDQRLRSWSRLTGKVNATNLAQHTLRTGILEPASASIAELSDDPLLQATLRESVGQSYSALGLFAEAIPMLRAAASGYEDALGPRDRRSLAARSALARANASAGQLEPAYDALRVVLQQQIEVLGPQHTDVGETLNTLGGVCTELLREEEAEEALRSALEICRAAYGADDPRTLRTMFLLGEPLFGLGRIEEATALYKDALERVQASGKPSVLEYMLRDALGELAGSQGDHATAVVIRQQAYEGIRGLLGDGHPTTLDALHSLANSLYSARRGDDAIEAWRELIAARTLVLGPDHPRTLSAEVELGGTLLDSGYYAEAERHAAETLPRLPISTSEESYQRILCATTLCDARTAQGKLEEAEPVCREAAERAATYDPDGRYGLARYALVTYATVLSEMGRNLQADARWLEAVRRYRAESGILSGQTFQVLSAYGEHLEKTGRAEQFEPLLRKHLEAAKEDGSLMAVLPPMERLTINLAEQGRFEEAEPIIREALAIAEEARPGDWRLVRMRSHLGYVLGGQERFDEAIPMLESCLATLEERIDEIPFSVRDMLILPIEARLDQVRAWADEALPVFD